MRRYSNAGYVAPSPTPIPPGSMAPILANSIDFGVTTTEYTMCIMQTFDAVGNVRVALKVGDHKEIEIQFPLTIDGRRRQLKFQLPLSLIENIYKVKNSLVIPFKSVCILLSL